MHEEVDDLDCTATYDHHVEIKPREVEVSVLCFESESDIKVFRRVIQLPNEIVVD